MKFPPCLLFLFLFSALSHSQSHISGTIKTEVGEALNGATVTISPDTTGVVLAYAISRADGSFELDLKAETDPVFLKVSYIGFKSWTRKIPNTDQQLEVILSESSEALKEVIVDASIISQRGDTLNFRVSAFTDQNDRVIADALKKMPGIDILPGGQIQYQGKPIQKYYINDLDLLEGRYSLANNNISVGDVSEVQILENHQPVKVLDSLEFSERASINIKLKKDVTMSGAAEVGAGFSPLLWKAKITPMLFTKNQQAIITYQANNTGKDVSSEIQDFSFSDFGREEFQIGKRDWLGIRKLAPPAFEQERWLDNNVHLGSVNYLIRLGKELDLKTNISYLNDFQQQRGSTRTRYFTPSDTIDLFEDTHNHLLKNTLQAKFIVEKNSEENYLKNELEVNNFWDSQRGKILTEDEQIYQRLSNPFSVIRNKFQMLRPLGKQLVTFRSNTGYTQSAQSLRVNPGQFTELINGGQPYEESAQLLETSTFFTDNSAGFTKGLGDFTIAPEFGFSLKNQQLDTRLFGQAMGNSSGSDFRNDLRLLSSRVYLSSSINYRKNNWNLRLLMPLNYRNFRREDGIFGNSETLNKFTFEPELFIKREISAYWESSVSARLSNDFSDLRNTYSGFNLSDYRSLQRYNTSLPQSFSQAYSGRLAYRNPLKALFANASYSYSRTKNNLLYSNELGEGGTLIFEAFEEDNFSSRHHLGLEASKYLRKIKTTLDLGTSYSLLQGEQLLNEVVTQVENRNLSFDIELDSELTEWLSASLSSEVSFLQTSLEQVDLNRIQRQLHLLDLSFFPAGNQFFGIESEYYHNDISGENQDSYFLNLEYQYTFKKQKLDLAASWNNVLGAEEFVSIFNNEFSYVQSTYRLRPSQLLVSLKFSF